MPIYKIHIPAATDEELKKELTTAAEILTGLSEAVHEYDSKYTSAGNKTYWKKRAKEWIDQHKIILG